MYHLIYDIQKIPYLYINTQTQSIGFLSLTKNSGADVEIVFHARNTIHEVNHLHSKSAFDYATYSWSSV